MTTYDGMTTPCECEHADHFDEDGEPHDGSEGCRHSYGAEVDIESMTEVRTEYGPFRVCVACREKHLPDEILA